MESVNYKYLDKCLGKTWVVGDVHGYVNTFRTILEKIKLSKTDRLILLGDLIDRGPDAKAMLDTVIDLKNQGYDVWCIKGNHDDMMTRSQQEELGNGKGLMRFMKRDLIKKSWLNMGGDKTMRSFSAKKMVDIDPLYFDLISNMYHYLEDDDFLYVHGGFNFNDNDPFLDAYSMMWIRDFKVNIGLTKGKKVIHGHTPVDIEFIKDTINQPQRDHFIALDNGVYLKGIRGKGNLLAFETSSKELIVQVVQDTEY